eukprot:scaffold379_cov235-Pinguiococcus_pyrenoidosus.AAC.13
MFFDVPLAFAEKAPLIPLCQSTFSAANAQDGKKRAKVQVLGAANVTTARGSRHFPGQRGRAHVSVGRHGGHWLLHEVLLRVFGAFTKARAADVRPLKQGVACADFWRAVPALHRHAVALRDPVHSAGNRRQREERPGQRDPGRHGHLRGVHGAVGKLLAEEAF